METVKFDRERRRERVRDLEIDRLEEWRGVEVGEIEVENSRNVKTHALKC